ncbi:MAG: hypothetical protein IJT43_00400 [Stomatobaculum sp.]|nr:hypothetical protein [Stomatobaculum sp.]
MNRYFSYPGKENWDSAEMAAIPAIPLTTLVSKVNMEMFTVKAKPEAERKNTGEYFMKPMLYAWPEFMAYLKENKLTFHTMGLGEMSYITIAPEEHMKENWRYDDPVDTLVIMDHTETEDPNYAMYVMEKRKAYLEMAAKARVILHFGMYKGWDCIGRIFLSMREGLVIHRYNYRRLYLDVTGLLAAGHRVSEAEGLTIPGFENADDAVVKFCGAGSDAVVKYSGTEISAVRISELWPARKRKVLLPSHGSFHNMGFDWKRHVNSRFGRRKAAAWKFFEEFDSIYDPALKEKLRSIGAVLDIHETKGEQWITIGPRQQLEYSGDEAGREEEEAWNREAAKRRTASKRPEKLPIVAYFGEVNAFDPAMSVNTLCDTFSFIELAAEGNFLLLLFALEDADSNDMMADMILEAQKLYPTDPERVYVTGHSHNGRFTAEFTRRHQKLVAAAAPLGNEPGQLSPEWTSGVFKVSDEQLKLQASVDTPIIMINGYNEINCMYPLYTDAPDPNPTTPFIALDTKDKRVFSWQRRLISMNCPMKTKEEICATEHSADYVEKKLGIPADRTEVQFVDGVEVCIADIQNRNGDYHFRVCAFENSPHEPSPAYADMMWSYLRRFARDQKTGETKELFQLK